MFATGKKFKGCGGIQYVQRLWGEGVCLFVGKADRGGKYSRTTVSPKYFYGVVGKITYVLT